MCFSIKKIALVFLALSATTFAAAGVKLYGTADLGLLYSTSKVSVGNQPAHRDHSVTMLSGGGSTSYFGIGCEETLYPGYKVSGKLEAIVQMDTGEVPDGDSHFFARESSLIVDTPYGSLAMGNMGTLASGAGTYDLFIRNADCLDGGLNSWNDAFACSMYMHWHYFWSNLITYRTPEINGFTGYVQYSGKSGYMEETEGEEGTRDAYRLLAYGASYEKGPLSLAMVYDEVHMPRAVNQTSRRLSFGGHYIFGANVIFAGTQVGRHAPTIGGYYPTENFWNGYMVHLGYVRIFPSSSLFLGLYYNRFKGDGHNGRSEKFNAVAAYYYDLTKRTSLYFGAGYLKHSMRENAVKTRANYSEFSFGICHKF